MGNVLALHGVRSPQLTSNRGIRFAGETVLKLGKADLIDMICQERAGRRLKIRGSVGRAMWRGFCFCQLLPALAVFPQLGGWGGHCNRCRPHFSQVVLITASGLQGDQPLVAIEQSG